LNQQLDPVQHRFRLHTAFDLIPKRGQPTRYEDFTTVIKPDGQLAVIEFTGALPRVRLYAHWQVVTNDTDILRTLTDMTFDPSQTVLVASPLPAPAASAATNATPGTVEWVRYAPKQLEFKAVAKAASVLLLNDKHDPKWQVWVDGQPAELLRCNYLMRGVFLTPGTHQIKFRFEPPVTALYVSLAALGAGLVLLGLTLGWPQAAPSAKTSSSEKFVPAVR